MTRNERVDKKHLSAFDKIFAKTVALFTKPREF